MSSIAGVQRITRTIVKGLHRMKATGSKSRIWVKLLQEDEIEGISDDHESLGRRSRPQVNLAHCQLFK